MTGPSAFQSKAGQADQQSGSLWCLWSLSWWPISLLAGCTTFPSLQQALQSTKQLTGFNQPTHSPACARGFKVGSASLAGIARPEGDESQNGPRLKLGFSHPEDGFEVLEFHLACIQLDDGRGRYGRDPINDGAAHLRIASTDIGRLDAAPASQRFSHLSRKDLQVTGGPRLGTGKVEMPHLGQEALASHGGQSSLELFAVGDEDNGLEGALGLVSPGLANKAAFQKILDALSGVVLGRAGNMGEDDLPELCT
ncbi:hypothetical protein PG996_009383 [Apiospora saccharicola]|uniref:Uncharacterized protein n=1 Tax=Apiospora saccharicola TaxID=335842 RepID=A0ABR1UKM7_9PEZI